MESWFCSPLLSIIRSFFQGADMRFSQSLKFNHIFRRLYRSGKNAANRYLVPPFASSVIRKPSLSHVSTG